MPCKNKRERLGLISYIYKYWGVCYAPRKAKTLAKQKMRPTLEKLEIIRLYFHHLGCDKRKCRAPRTGTAKLPLAKRCQFNHASKEYA